MIDNISGVPKQSLESRFQAIAKQTQSNDRKSVVPKQSLESRFRTPDDDSNRITYRQFAALTGENKRPYVASMPKLSSYTAEPHNYNTTLSQHARSSSLAAGANSRINLEYR